MTYQPIENYGIIGNMRTAALVGVNGSIDWYCFPYFDSPSMFAKLLDSEKGGSYWISPVHNGHNTKQLYWPDTNVLVTRFLSPEGVGELQDFMPVGAADVDDRHDELVRRVRVSRGEMEFEILCEPAFDYARGTHKTHILEDCGAAFETEKLTMGLSTEVELKPTNKGGVRGRFTLRQGEEVTFILRPVEPGESLAHCPSEERAEQMFERTVSYWRHWLSRSNYKGRWRDIMNRAVLTLKLLTFEPTGAMVAAPTCSLPESIGGERNWDYRYCWIRDAAFTVYAFLRLGFTEEAKAFMEWLRERYRHAHDEGPLQIVYGLDGRTDLSETSLEHLEGYRNSTPVRIGNGAHSQLQLDIYGEMLDSVYLYNKYAEPISYDAWCDLRYMLDWLCENWHRKDEGIWEVRSGRQHFVYSKLMCWVAMDRGLRLAEKRSLPADQVHWRTVRNTIYEEILTRGWNPKLQAFTQHYESDCLDASNLIMPLVFFMAPNDPKMLATIDATNRPPHEGGLVSDGMVYRYDAERSPDGLEGGEGTFNMCSFWLVEALTRAGHTHPEKLDEARLLFERMLGYANHLGLYAEETGASGEALGNFPQAFTHLALISAGFNLDRALGGKD
ncbi:glycoside hydrolase family 15 protein [Thalassoroseus pseudoceratinae]|uniref:glycoside hydrolase family 15 protein n=1 Tax=Thalassoroseus pseudoceratinae TaxID=2713176 RepID=UPI0014207BF5|nr:glycoside hydrolase family 15 protein [Thalassoroseus pseudoceratinae]